MYPLNAKLKAHDLIGENIPGKLSSVRPIKGPFGIPGGSSQFLGRTDSYIELPNNGGLDTKSSITLLAWVYPQTAGPIIDYKTNGQGVHMWMANPRKLMARFGPRGSRTSSFSLSSSSVTPLKWNFLGASYDHDTGKASLWIDGKLAAIKNIGVFKLATTYPVRMGDNTGHSRHFRGRIACMQVYDKALDSEQILAARDLCKRYMKHLNKLIKRQKISNLHPSFRHRAKTISIYSV